MFSKAKRFQHIAPTKDQSKDHKKTDSENTKTKTIVPIAPKTTFPEITPLKVNPDTRSQCSSAKSSVKSFVTPKPVKPTIKPPSSLKKALPVPNKIKNIQTKNDKVKEDIINSQEVEIRNKNYTIVEYNKQIEDLKNEIASLQKQIKDKSNDGFDADTLNTKIAKIKLNDESDVYRKIADSEQNINNLNKKIIELENQCDRLEQEVSSKQVELTSLEDIITIRDSLCQDLQQKLTNVETVLEETRQRLEMVKGHHALALEANESIRREYKAELESLKLKLEEDKQAIYAKCKSDQENVKAKYNSKIESLKEQLLKEKDEVLTELKKQLANKDHEMKAKLEQIDEATHEKLRLCEIQFEERSRNIQEHWAQQQIQIKYLENEARELKINLNSAEQQNDILQREMNNLKNENNNLRSENEKIMREVGELKEESKKKMIDFENEINRLTLEVDRTLKEKNKFDMSLSVTRDIVQVLTMRLRESDNELEHLENKVQTLTNSKDLLEDELAGIKNKLNNTILECNEYKEALVNILKSKAALTKEHTRIMEHNVSLIESLQNVEKEAYRELGSIKNELIEDVELLKKESKSQIQMLREEVEKKRMLCEMATEHAGQANAAAEQSRVLLGHASSEISRLETENQRLQKQIQDQQSLVVELSLLRQENEELTMTLAKQTSMMDKMKKDAEQIQAKPKSPAVLRKSLKLGKENLQTVVSPLRERNH